MKKVALLVGLLLGCVGLASAGTMTLQFNQAEGNNLGGEYTYPYQFSINNNGNTYNLFCDTFNHEITNGEQWSANALLVTNLNATNIASLEFPGIGVMGYLEATMLFNQAVAAFNGGNGTAASELNWAVWDLMLNSDVSQANLTPSQEAAVQAFLHAAMVAGPGLAPGQFVGDVIYTPTDQTAGGPQEFFGFDTPTLSEPGSLSLLGSGLFGFGMLIRRKFPVI
jgi:hypothetical protein